jgi:hypothetical protein
MEKNIGNNISYILEQPKTHKDFLGSIRHWSNVKIAANDTCFFIKDITAEQASSLEINSIPYKTLYTLEDNKLFPIGSNVPIKKLPTMLLWTTMERGLPILLPAYNHNYFGIQETISVSLKATDVEQPAVAMYTPVETIANYIETAPAVRLKNLTWVIVNNTHVLLLGTPLLPIEGQTYWCYKDCLLPTGFDIEYSLLRDIINNNVNDNAWALWHIDGSYSAIPKISVMPLSISSFRISTNLIKNHRSFK